MGQGTAKRVWNGRLNRRYYFLISALLMKHIMTNINIHHEYVCKRKCGYEMVVGVESTTWLSQAMRDECPRCGSDLQPVNSL